MPAISNAQVLCVGCAVATRQTAATTSSKIKMPEYGNQTWVKWRHPRITITGEILTIRQVSDYLKVAEGTIY